MVLLKYKVDVMLDLVYCNYTWATFTNYFNIYYYNSFQITITSITLILPSRPIIMELLCLIQKVPKKLFIRTFILRRQNVQTNYPLNDLQ